MVTLGAILLVTLQTVLETTLWFTLQVFLETIDIFHVSFGSTLDVTLQVALLALIVVNLFSQLMGNLAVHH